MPQAHGRVGEVNLFILTLGFAFAEHVMCEIGRLYNHLEL